MDARNFTFMFYGFLAAWLIVLFYVISLARRGARLKRSSRMSSSSSARIKRAKRRPLKDRLR